MRCGRAQRRLEAFLDGGVGPRERARLERHLAACPECGQVLERARRLRALLGREQTRPVPAGFHARLMARAREQTAEPNWSGLPARLGWTSAMPAPLRAAAVGAVVLAIGVGLFIGRDIAQPVNPTRAAQARPAVADPVSIYRIDYFGEAPEDSLAGAYVSLLSGGERR
jgi:anti-sigma factor (TIGR02949 family)